MSSNTFRFKRFAVQQPRGAGMKVGTDGVLLGAWCDLRDARTRLLDVGTGTGVIALMLAQRALMAAIDAVDIDPECCELAALNIAASPWPQRVKVVCAPVQRLAEESRALYDHIVSNPPYFTESLLPPSPERIASRHTTALTHTQLLGSAAALLVEGGRLSIILPMHEAAAIVTLAPTHGLHPRRATQVNTRRGAEPKRTLLELVKTSLPPDVLRETLAIHEAAGEDFTEEYRALTREFYLKF
jgi:tRNA1Val (adenine37-N6)-methyltransferase